MAKNAGWNWPDLEVPYVDKSVIYLWHWFLDVGQARTYGINGMPNYLSWCEIKAWTELTNRKPNEWEISTLRAIDRGYLNG